MPPEIEQIARTVMHPALEHISPTKDVKTTSIGNIVSVEGIISLNVISQKYNIIQLL